MDDYVSLDDGNGYGLVDDVLFTEDGNIQAVVVNADGAYGGGAYAYPFYGFDYGWDPGYSAYTLPYADTDLENVSAFDYDEYDGFWQ